MSGVRERYRQHVQGPGLVIDHAVGDTAWNFIPRQWTVVSVAECPAAGTLRVLHDGGVLVELDLQTGAPVRVGDLLGYAGPGAVLGCGGERLATKMGVGVEVIDVSNAVVLCTCEDGRDAVAVPDVRQHWLAGFSRDGALLLGATLGAGGARPVEGATLWNAHTGALVASWPATAPPSWSASGDAVFSYDGGARALTRRGTDGAVQWSRELALSIDSMGHRPYWLGLPLVCSSDGAVVMLGGTDPKRGGEPGTATIAAFDAGTGRPLWSCAHVWQPWLLPVPGTSRVVEIDTAMAFDVGTGEEALVAPDVERALRVSFNVATCVAGDGSVFYVAGDGYVARIDMSTGTEIEGEGIRVGRARRVAVSGSGARVVTVGHANELRVWRRETAEPECLLEGWSDLYLVVAVAFTADERFVMAASHDRAMFWSLATGLHDFTLPFDAPAAGAEPEADVALTGVVAVALHPDAHSMLLVGSPPGDQDVRVLVCYDLSTRRVSWRATLPPHLWTGRVTMTLDAEGVCVCAARNDRSFLVSFSRSDGAMVGAVTELAFAFGEVFDHGPVPYARNGVWSLQHGGLCATQMTSAGPTRQGYAIQDVDYPLVTSADGRWLVTSTFLGDAVLWRTRLDPRGGEPAAEFAEMVRLEYVDDALASAAFDARGETLVFGTARGALLFCTLAP